MDRNTEGVFLYHEETKHRPGRYARSPVGLDWDNQPAPFRRFAGCPEEKLPFTGKDPGKGFSSLFTRAGNPAGPFNIENISTFLELSMGLSAWKSYIGSAWALRMNPSSGNLHPTEAYLALPPLEDNFSGGVFHYDPYGHALERRAVFDKGFWKALREHFGTDGFIAGLTSIYWREAWKYGERAFRYSNLDIGHAAACMSFSAALLGWRVLNLNALSDGDVRTILGLNKTRWPEFEEDAPGPLFFVHPADKKTSSKDIPEEIIRSFEGISFSGEPELLSRQHTPWPIIDEVSRSTVKPRTEGRECRLKDSASIEGEMPDVTGAGVIRKRRSGQAYDSAASVLKKDLLAILDRTIPRSYHAPFDICLGEPLVHLIIFAHRVTGLKNGLYILVRNDNDTGALKGALHKEFLWEAISGLDGLFLLREGDFSKDARLISCNQEIAELGVAAFGMLTRFRENITREPYLYRQMHWEAGLLGHVLYLGAEAHGLRGTGIGCFLDDLFHNLLGLKDNSYQVLYNFTMGMAVEDRRISTLPPYHHLPHTTTCER